MPSTLKTQLTEDMKTALKAHDTLKLGVVRFLLSLLKNVEIDHGEQDDAGVVKIIQSEIKKTKDALSDFEKSGRAELIADEKQKIAVMESYLPAQLSDDAIMAKIKEIQTKTGETHPGKLTGLVMAEVKGQTDGGRVATLIKQVLG